MPDGIGTGRLLFLRPDTNGFASYTYIVGECLSNNNPDGTSTECISIYGSSGSSKKVCNTAINMCKTIDCHYENLVGSGPYAETCVSPAGNLADACSGSTERMALCNYGTNSCYYYNTSCSGDTPACAVDADGRAVCVECTSDANCASNPNGKYCDTANNKCVECLTNDDLNADGVDNDQCRSYASPKTCDSAIPSYPNRFAQCNPTSKTCNVCGQCFTNSDCKNNFCCDADPALPVGDWGTGLCNSGVYKQKYLCAT